MARARAKVGPQFCRENWVGVNPITRGRDTRNRGTLQMQFAPPFLELDHDHLPTGDSPSAAPATALIVERMPVMEFIEVTQDIELVFRRQLQRIVDAHFCQSRQRNETKQ